MIIRSPHKASAKDNSSKPKTKKERQNAIKDQGGEIQWRTVDENTWETITRDINLREAWLDQRHLHI